NSTRIEYRSPDPATNPYILFALMLKAGLDGIKNRIMPPEPMHENAYWMEASNPIGNSLERYPRDLQEALEEMTRDPLVVETMGEYVFNCYLISKQKEWDQYAECVNGWEIRKYLRRL
ncbi:MAG: type I glutamate--ammonia ligase, partial [Clostridia bacterium]|nr:type I glutamate--ammonia ligase [Clostridia bacterium]